MIPNLQVLVPQNWSKTDRGNFFENIVSNILKRMRFKTLNRVRVTGMEIDVLAENLDTQQRAFVECKFQKDPLEAEIISKLIGNAFQLPDINIAYLFSTARLGKEAQGRLLEIQQNDNLIRGLLRFAYISPEDLVDIYLDVNGLPSIAQRLQNLPEDFKKTISSVSLIIAPDEACWLLEQKEEGIPTRAFLIPLKPEIKNLTNFTFLKNLIDEAGLWIGLIINDGLPTLDLNKNTSLVAPKEIIIPVPMAERFEDYGPARPQDFVGRDDLLKRLLEFFDQIREGNPSRRVIALSGMSGFGKSSFVLRLSSEAHTPKWKNKLFIYHVDIRSATSPLFVAEALKVAFQSAIDQGFINEPGLQISIDSVESLFSSNSLQLALSGLKKQGRLLVIFFDQFEELLIKESLLGAFEAFKRLAFEVEALQSNLLVGFSWRTGILLSESHPAYHMWHSLQDRRAEFKISPFSEAETKKMIGVLEKNLGYKLESLLRRNLLEQAQGLPWLLKKFCVHIYTQLLSGISQQSLVVSQLKASTLFDEDTKDLSVDQLNCLRYIAMNSPVDLVDVHEKFSGGVPDSLYHARLIIRSGERYSVYWDIFREYLASGQIPPMPLTFLPQSSLSTSLSVLEFIRNSSSSVTDQIISYEFGYTIKVAWNIIGDLSAFFIIEKQGMDAIAIVDELIGRDDLATASYISQQLERHIIVKQFHEMVKPGEGISFSQLEELVSEFYPSTQQDSLHSYMKRFLQWLRFAGLVEVEAPEQIIRPRGEGQEKGKVVKRHSKLLDGKAIFLCTSSPKKVIQLATRLYLEKKISREQTVLTSLRNAAQDLTALELAKWDMGDLIPLGQLAQNQKFETRKVQKAIRNLIGEVALNSKFLKMLIRELSVYPPKSDKVIANEIAKDLGKVWKPSSVQRYMNGGKRWLAFFDQLQKLQGQRSIFDDTE